MKPVFKAKNNVNPSGDCYCNCRCPCFCLYPDQRENHADLEIDWEAINWGVHIMQI